MNRAPPASFCASAGALAGLALAGFSAGASSAKAAEPFPVPSVDARAVAFDDLPGIASDDLAAAFAVFRLSCTAGTSSHTARLPALHTACARARALPTPIGAAAAYAFFAANFTPQRITAPAFFTGYYEPVLEGALQQSAAFPIPLMAPPAGFIAGAPASYRRADGAVAPVPDRAAIEAGALGQAARPLVWLREPVDAFFVAIQGSARVRLPDGRLRRVAFAGRNGSPYTAIGKVLVARLSVPPDQMGMAELRAWIRANGQGADADGTRLMQRNASYIFFHFDDALPPGAGPVGAAGASLTALRSLAIDKAVWPYGLPFYVAAELPWESEQATPLRRMMVAQDTGAAITGPARADIFFGTGPDAATRAGAIRQAGTLFVLWPKAHADAPTDGGATGARDAAR